MRAAGTVIVLIRGRKNASIERVSKLHLILVSVVAIRIKMLTYFVYAPLLIRLDASLTSII